MNDIKFLNKDGYSSDDKFIAFIYNLKKMYNITDDIIIMPDYHPGKDNAVGYVQEITGKVSPKLLGGDLGCGMTCVKLDISKDDVINQFNKLENIVTTVKPRLISDVFDYNKLNCYKNISKKLEGLTIGQLGSGNHFLELGYNVENDEVFLTVHSGSQLLGQSVFNYYNSMSDNYNQLNDKLNSQYIEDVINVSEVAKLNRIEIINQVTNRLGIKYIDFAESVHNTIDYVNNTKSDMMLALRKGATTAFKDEKVIIPINPSDGILIATGLGNKEYLSSAPHGAGRVLSRSAAKDFRLELQEEMELLSKDIHMTWNKDSKISESPSVYRSIKEIEDNIQKSCKIDFVINPLFSHKE